MKGAEGMGEGRGEKGKMGEKREAKGEVKASDVRFPSTFHNSVSPLPNHLSPFSFLSFWAPVLLWAGLIFYLSGIPNLRFVEAWWDIIVRKIGHMGIFGILARLLARALTGTTFWPWKKIFFAAFLLTVLYAASDEYHQSFVPGRGPSAVDVVIDAAGAWMALGLVP